MFDNAFLKTLRILYIESDESTNKHFSNILNKMFKSVNSLQSPQEASKLIKEDLDSYDIIICDLILDNSSGITILEELRAVDENKPYILTAKDVIVEELIKAIKLKANDFLLKPVNGKNLVYAVEQICHNYFHDELITQTNDDLKHIEEVINEVAMVSKTDAKGNITFVNKHFCDITKYLEIELLENNHEIIKDTKTNPIVYQEIEESIKKEETWKVKIKELTKENEEFHSYLTILPITNRNGKVKEYMWVRFLATEYEQEQKDFKNKVKKNINESRRINNDARNKIDELQNKILYYQSLDESIKHEKQRDEKFTKQLKYYESEIKTSNEKLKEVSNKANKKIKEVVTQEKITRLKRDETLSTLKDLTEKLDIKNKNIKELTKELDNQKKIIKKLKLKIDNREYELGLND